MFSISENIFSQFKILEMNSFLRKLLLLLRENVPSLSDLSDAQVIEDIKKLSAEAQSFGIATERGIAVYVVTASQLGLDYAAKFPGAFEILQSQEVEDTKIELLQAFTLNILELLES